MCKVTIVGCSESFRNVKICSLRVFKLQSGMNVNCASLDSVSLTHSKWSIQISDCERVKRVHRECGESAELNRARSFRVQLLNTIAECVLVCILNDATDVSS